ncbi:hypothetical protein JCM21900_000161 [Sporobolomyces salmonicolor]
MSNALGGAAGSNGPSGQPQSTLTFDPLAPLHSSQAPAYNTIGTPASSPSPSRNPLPPSPTPPSQHSTSLSGSRAPRPSSLYIPMDDGNRVGGGTGNTPTWPFDSTGNGVGGNGDDSLRIHPPSNGPPPLSPSMIHPSYAEPSDTGAFHPSPLPSGPAHNLYSAIPIAVSSPVAEAAAYSTSAYRSPSPSILKSGTFGNRQLSMSSLASGIANSPRHASTYSLGTHSLLSSRQAPATSSLAEQLDTPTAWLVLYFAFNLGLTLFNKLVLQGFPFPWTLTAIQMLSGTIGTQIALQQGYFVQSRLTTKENGTMILFSGLYTINIAVSNLSLHLVSVPFHQVVRAMTPLFTIIISAVLWRKRHSRATYLSLVPVVLGVVFATYGDYSFTAWGFILTLLGTLLAALKTIITNRVQVGRLKLHPLDLLVRMSPLAFMQCVFFGWWSGELDRVRVYGATEMTKHKAIALAVNGAIAFGLNVVSFTANKKTSALTMTVAANVKQVLTIVLAVLIFNVALNPTNLLGISLTLAGGAWYARVELQEKTARAAAAASTSSRVGEGEKLG